MAQAQVRGHTIRYEILGERGPWVALSPGGRRGLDGVASLGGKVAAAGYRVLVHDRRNTGASDVVIEGDESEYEIWADDLYALAQQLGAAPLYVGGSSSGCRTSLLVALRHPDAVQGLLLWRVTGGPFAAQRLARQYYGDFIEVAQRGGMAAVCDTEFFKERIEANPRNREYLLSMDPAHFIAVMSRWRESFLQGANLPVIGATAEALGSIRVPTLVIPGNDRTHGRQTGETAARLIPGAELQILAPEDVDEDVADWDAKEDDLATRLIGFLNRVSAAARV